MVIPEATLGGYPKGSLFGTYLGYRLQSGREEFARYYKQAIVVGNGHDSPEIKLLEEFSTRIDASVVIGESSSVMADHCTVPWYLSILNADM